VSGAPRFSAGYRLPTGSGAVIMAGGIFGAVALQALPHGPLFTKPLAVLLLAELALMAGAPANRFRTAASPRRAG
jgi:hypothetical protein